MQKTADRLKAMNNAGVNYNRIAAQAGINRTTVSRYAAGQIKGNINTEYKIDNAIDHIKKIIHEI